MRANTHLGNERLHKKHSVMIEGGQIPRSRVMDQMMIDRYLMDGLLDLTEHQAGEHLLGLARHAGLWPTGVNLSGRSSRSSRPDFSLTRGMGYQKNINAIKRKYGWFHGYLTERVVCFNWDVREDNLRVQCLKDALNFIALRAGCRDPLQSLAAGQWG